MLRFLLRNKPVILFWTFSNPGNICYLQSRVPCPVSPGCFCCKGFCVQALQKVRAWDIGFRISACRLWASFHCRCISEGDASVTGTLQPACATRHMFPELLGRSNPPSVQSVNCSSEEGTLRSDLQSTSLHSTWCRNQHGSIQFHCQR